MTVASSSVSVVNCSCRVSQCLMVRGVGGGKGCLRSRVVALRLEGMSLVFVLSSSGKSPVGGVGKVSRLLSAVELAMVSRSVDRLRRTMMVTSCCFVGLGMSAVEGSLTGMMSSKLCIACLEVVGGLCAVEGLMCPMGLGSHTMSMCSATMRMNQSLGALNPVNSMMRKDLAT